MELLTPGHHADHARSGLQSAHPLAYEESVSWTHNTADLLADLMHLADEEDFSFTDALDKALDHYSHEIEQ